MSYDPDESHASENARIREIAGCMEDSWRDKMERENGCEDSVIEDDEAYKDGDG